jgi:putative chitinase
MNYLICLLFNQITICGCMKYFTLEEFTRSETATKLGIKNTPTKYQKDNIIEMVNNILDPLRDAWAVYCKRYNLGSPGIRVLSGVRSAALNSAVGGSRTSAHYLGYAADLMPCNGKMGHFKRFCIEWLFDKDFDQMISENEDSTGTPKWIHIGYKNSVGQFRRQYMYMVNGKYYSLSERLTN